MSPQFLCRARRRRRKGRRSTCTCTSSSSPSGKAGASWLVPGFARLPARRTGGRWGSTAPAFCGSKTSPLHPTACETAQVSPKTGQIRQTHFIISQPLAWEGAGGKWRGDGGWPPLTPCPSPQAQPALLERRLLRRRALRAQEALPHHQVGPGPSPKNLLRMGNGEVFPLVLHPFSPKEALEVCANSPARVQPAVVCSASRSCARGGDAPVPSVPWGAVDVLAAVRGAGVEHPAFWQPLSEQ